MRAVLVAAVLAAAAGCGGGPNVTPDAPPPPEKAFQEIGALYKYLSSSGVRAPRKLEDLQEFDASLVTAWPKIQSGEIVINWGVGYSAQSLDVLAYEKAAPSAGGRVVLRNGTVKTVTAAEFKGK